MDVEAEACRCLRMGIRMTWSRFYTHIILKRCEWHRYVDKTFVFVRVECSATSLRSDVLQYDSRYRTRVVNCIHAVSLILRYLFVMFSDMHASFIVKRPYVYLKFTVCFWFYVNLTCSHDAEVFQHKGMYI